MRSNIRILFCVGLVGFVSATSTLSHAGLQAIFAIQSGKQWLDQGDQAAAQENVTGAVRAYKKAMRDPDTEEVAMLKLVKFIFDRGDRKNAQKILETFLRKDSPFPIEGRLMLAEIYIEQGKIASAIRHLDVVNTLWPGNLAASELRGIAMYKSAKYDDAVSNLTAYLKPHPDAVRARTIRGQSYFELGMFNQSLEDFKVLANGSNPSAETFERMGDAYVGLKQYPNAQHAFEVAVQKEPTADRYSKLGKTFENRDLFAESAPHYVKAVEMDPERMDRRFKLGEIYLKLKRVADAEREFRHEFQLDSSFDPAVQHLVQILVDYGRNDEAGRVLRRYTRLYPDRTWAVYKYSRLLASIGEYDKAFEIISKFGKTESSTVYDLALMKAVVYKAQNRPTDALQALYRADQFYTADKAIASRDPLNFNIAMFEDQLGHYDRAIERYQMVTDDAALKQKAHVNLAFVYEKTGDFTAAIKTLREGPFANESKAYVGTKIAELESHIKERDEGRFQQRLPASETFGLKNK